MNGDGELSTDFLSAQPPTTRGAEGMLEAVKNGFQEIGYDFETKAAKQLTGITTDGESANTGHKSGLWSRLQEVGEKKLLTYWCTAHRSNLAFKSARNQVAELNILLNDLQSVATFFRTSGVHARELQGTAQERFPQITLLHFPQFKEVRFAEFPANLLRAFVRNIPICLHYWKHLSESNESNREEKNKSKGFLNTWLSKDKLQLIHVYLDIAEIVQSLQMRFQNKQLTILEVEPARDSALAKIKQTLDKPKAGGYEAKFLEQVEDDKFHGFPLLSERSRRATN